MIEFYRKARRAQDYVSSLLDRFEAYKDEQIAKVIQTREHLEEILEEEND